MANIFLDDFEYSNSLPAGSSSSSSDIVAAGSCSTNVKAVNFQATDITASNALKAWSFQVRDGGGSADADANPTIVDSLRLIKGGQDDVSGWGSAIRRAALYSGGVEKAEVSVTGDTIVFGDLNYNVADNADSTLSLYLTFENSFTDNRSFQFKITNNLVKTTGTTSSFKAFACSSSTAGDTNRIEAVATALNFSVQPPASVGANIDFSAALEAVDANGNRDLDAAPSATLARGAGTGTLSSGAGLTQTLASGWRNWTDLRYNTIESGVTIVATAVGLIPDTSSAINVTGEVGSITAGGDSTEPASISALMDSQGEAVLNFDFTVTDDGNIPGTDALPTLIDTIVIYQGTGNDVVTWYQAIAGAVLMDNSGNSFSGAVGGTVLRFNHIPTGSGSLGYVADNATKHYRLKCWLNSDLSSLRDTIDGLHLAFRVNRSSYRCLTAGSSAFVSGDGANVEAGASNNRVSVTATALNFAYQPQAPVYRSTTFRADVEAVDSNNNRDSDASDAVTLALAAGTGTLSSGAGLVQNLVSGLRSWTDLQYDLSETGVLIRASAGLAPDTCDPFAVIESEPATQASGLAFSAVGETQMTVSWTSGNGTGRILLAKAGQLVSHPPVDGNAYTADNVLGSGSQIGTNNFVVYAGSGNSVTVIGLSPATRYFFAVYEYNGAGVISNYLTTAPDTNSQMTNTYLLAGDFQSRQAGNWNSVSTWDQWNGSSWSAASTIPASANSVYLSSTDTVTLDANGQCKNLIMYGAASGMRLTLNTPCTLSVSGTLTSADIIPGSALIKGGGLVRFVGGTRALFGSTWSANPPVWRFEVALNPGDTGKSSSAVKAGQITISSGTFIVGTSSGHDLRPDSNTTGSDSIGSVRVASGATLIVLGNISRTSTGTAECALVDVSGVLKLAGRNLSAKTITVNNGGRLVSTRAAVPRGHLITGTLTYADGSSLEYDSGTPDSVQATGAEMTASVHDLVINNSAGDTLKSDVTVNGSLNCLRGRLITGSNTVTLAANAPLHESDTSNVLGLLKLTRTLSQSVADTFNGMGLSLNAGGAAPGATTVVRTTGRHYGVGGNQGIDRSFSVTPALNSGLGATLSLSYRETELNGLAESDLCLFRSANNGASWDSMGGTADPGANTMTLAGINSFSLWTAGKAGTPLAVGLTSFTAVIQSGRPELTWRVESETGTYQWAVERSPGDEAAYQVMARLQAQGSFGQAHEYKWTDNEALPGQNYYYQLCQLLTDGQTVYYGPIQASIVSSLSADDILLSTSPNPFSMSTLISYQVGQVEKNVSLNIYNISGQLVKTLFSGRQAPGSYSVKWNGINQRGTWAGNGVYICRLVLGNRTLAKRMTLLR